MGNPRKTKKEIYSNGVRFDSKTTVGINAALTWERIAGFMRWAWSQWTLIQILESLQDWISTL